MFNTMANNPEVLINDVEQAKERVKKGGYAYLMGNFLMEVRTKIENRVKINLFNDRVIDS